MRISTKRGDDGESGLFNGKRLSKGDAVFELLGGIDELNSFLGVCKAGCEDTKWSDLLEKVQNDLYKMMSLIGNEGEAPQLGAGKIEGVASEDLEQIERAEEELEQEVGPLTKFVNPGAGELSANFHVARSVCRRVEREAVRFSRENELDQLILKYLNRLSDLLFLLAVKYEG